MRRILIAACGLYPQVITETLYALLQAGKMPHSLHILTTRPGKEQCLALLFDKKFGKITQLLNDYKMPLDSLEFHSGMLHSPHRENGEELDDIVSEEDSALFLRLCMEQAFMLTQDKTNSVYFSIAGGRKTMGASLSLAAQCYARPQDRIFHVLVSPEFEQVRDFFYPPPEPVSLSLRAKDGSVYQKSTRHAHITLVPMPFVSIRDRLGGDLLREPEEPATLLASLVRELPQDLLIDMGEKKIVWQNRELDMPPAHIALLAFFAQYKKDFPCKKTTCQNCSACFIESTDVFSHQEDIVRLYQRVASISATTISDTGITNLNTENFNAYKSKINRSIEISLGKDAVRNCAITSLGVRPNTRYGIALEKARIKITF